MFTPTITVYYGSLINPTTLTSYETITGCLIAVNAHGNIDWIIHDVKDSSIQETLLQKGLFDADVTIVPLQEGQFIMPGFVDTHTHAPQVPNTGTGYQSELLDWLENFTFPMEANFQDVDFAKKVYPSIIKKFIASGTTTCCYYGTLHLESNKVLTDIVHSLGQRALIGKCNMDRNCPSYYIETSSSRSISDTQAFISYVRSLAPGPSNNPGNPLIYPVVTPRFAISCTNELLSSLKTLVHLDTRLHIQTHISENMKEVEYTKELYPDCEHYAGVYDSYGLLRNNTILAHAIWLQEKEIDLVKEREVGISHCPTSNFNLRSGIAPIGKYLDRGVKIGLGTDVSGGFSASMLVAMRNASIASTVVALQNNPTNAPIKEGKFTNRQLPLATLLYLATKGGAEVCVLDQQIGSLEPGKSFDALIVDVSSISSTSKWPGDVDPALRKISTTTSSSRSSSRAILEGLLEKFVFCGDDRNVFAVFVQGKLIGGTSYA
ncbi:Metallo-dependent hydrolase [Lentinula aff. detonsa]|uniref:Guanine deaminase n=1 Tax=Lentinula aff. detonsa TaxID=2804958 RepID=A0AA38NMM3_9AGAR|nr:Metallo-dependent hydrolase [Lentinula aff. detonsa]